MIQVTTKSESSYLLICPVCFDCWARIEGSLRIFYHRYVCCEDHSATAYGYHPAGCLLEVEECDVTLLDSLPPELIEREFNLYLRSYNSECSP